MEILATSGNRKIHWTFFIPIIFALIICSSKFGLEALSPFNDLWLMTASSDWSPDYMAWMFYRNADWSFPLGVFQGYSYPETVSIGLTGAIPLIAVPMKLFRSILPTTFQYFGMWLFLCYVLHAIFSYRLLRLIGIKDPIIRMLGACFLVLSYSLLDRLAHTNLCAHWQILAGLCVYFGVGAPKKALWQHALIIGASVWTHPYLVVFTLTIAWANYLKFYLKGDIKMVGFLAYLFSGIASVAFAWVLIGNHVLKSKSAAGEGFGVFSANLNTFWSPKIDGVLMPALATYYHTQFEGVAYLGIASIAAAFLLIFFIWRSAWKPTYKKEYFPIIALSIALFIFALSNQITFYDYRILNIKLPSFIMSKLSILRASGRYVWLIQYLLMVSFIYAYYKIDLKRTWKYLILGTVIVLNFIDFWPQIKQNKYIAIHTPPVTDEHKDTWTDIMVQAEDYIMFPAHNRIYNAYGDDMFFAEIAGKNKLNFNSGHLARFNGELRQEYSAGVRDTLENKPHLFHSKTIITGEKHLQSFDKLLENKTHSVFSIDGFYAFVPNKKNGKDNALVAKIRAQSVQDSIATNIESFQTFVERNKSNYMLIAAMDDAASYLSNCTYLLEFMENAGSVVPDLNFRESYAGIINNGKIIAQKRGLQSNGKKETASITQQINFRDNGKTITKKIDLYSADKDNGNEARIFVADENYSENERGLNIVILSPSGKVLESTHFDTFKFCHHFSEKSTLFYTVWRIR